MSIQSLGMTILVRRKQMNFGQDELAFACKRSQSWVAKVEAGVIEPSVTDVAKLSKLLRLDVRAMLAEALHEHDAKVKAAIKKFLATRNGKAEALAGFAITNSTTSVLLSYGEV